MGGTSQSRKSSNKKAMSRKDEMKGDPKQKRSTSNQQTLDGTRPTQFNPATAKLDPTTKGTCVDDFGHTKDRKRCIRGNTHKHGHEHFCTHSKYFQMGALEIDAKRRQERGDRMIRATAKLGPAKVNKISWAKFFGCRESDVDRDQPASPAKDSQRTAKGPSLHPLAPLMRQQLQLHLQLHLQPQFHQHQLQCNSTLKPIHRSLQLQTMMTNLWAHLH